MIPGILCECALCLSDFCADEPPMFRVRWLARVEAKLYEPAPVESVHAVPIERALLVGSTHADLYAGSVFWKAEAVCDG